MVTTVKPEETELLKGISTLGNISGLSTDGLDRIISILIKAASNEIVLGDIQDRWNYTLSKTNGNVSAALSDLEKALADPQFSTEGLYETKFALEFGKRVKFGRFMYGEREDWEALIKTRTYKPLHDGFGSVEAEIMPGVAEFIEQAEIKEIYSMGPSPEIDAQLLEQLARKGRKITYNAIDTNEQAVKESLEEVAAYLNNSFGNDSWKEYVAFGTYQATDFTNVKSNGPSCVIYTGGTISNSLAFWDQSSRIAQEGGLVVVSTATDFGEKDYSDYWLSMYNIPEGHTMFRKALFKAFPDLFKEENKNKWEISFEYVREPNCYRKWARHQTPKISIQLKIKESFTIEIDGVETFLTPRKTWAEIDEEGLYGSNVPYPIELITSVKPNLADFLLTTPETFGLSNVGHTHKDIDYKIGEKQGMVAAAVYVAGKPADKITLNDLLN